MSHKTKIVITGGLGYIGSELCKSLSGDSRQHDITVVDNRFVSERVKQLSDWGIKFVQSDILNLSSLLPIFKDVDVVYHLAGITDVAYTKTESNKELDELITKVGIDGTQNVISAVETVGKPYACIIFPSTHVVYEGFDEQIENIDEVYPVAPILAYSKVKVVNEKQLTESGINYVILRLGSVYGYSTDTMRVGIMPNLFSKITALNGTIKLFGGGKQLKSLVNIHDVVEIMRLMESRYFLSSKPIRETYHCVTYNTTVKEVAEICKEINPNVTLIETNDEIPNLGYTLSNQKLVDSGAQFLFGGREGLKKSLREMISNWTVKHRTELEYKLPPSTNKDIVDERGLIRNYDLPESINMIGYITSKAGTVRANHYHPIQQQKVLLVSGQYISVYQDLVEFGAPIHTQLINAGDCVVTEPNVAHTMVFTKDSVLLNLVNGGRKHEEYGVTHTIPHMLVNEQFRKDLLATYKSRCRVCGSEQLQRYISLGMSPLANNLIQNPDDFVKMYPLDINFCEQCSNSQLSCVVPPREMFDNYLYRSSTTQTFRRHFEQAAEKYIELFNLNKDSLVVDIGSNDGVGIQPFLEKGVRAVGVEPAANLVKIANDCGCTTIRGYFDGITANTIRKLYGKADLITASNVFAHSDELALITSHVKSLLKETGTFIVEVQYLKDTIEKLSFDNIYHEHVNYWTVTSLSHFFKQFDMGIWDVEHIDTHGGSIRVYVSRFKKPLNSVQEFMLNESDMRRFSTYKQFEKRVTSIKENVIINIHNLYSRYGIIYGYGSPAKATTALNYYGIGGHYISATIEDNELKRGLYIPGVNIPIISKEEIPTTDHPIAILILAWNFADAIKKNNAHLNGGNVKFLTINDLTLPPNEFENLL
jgi:nucleoside-diphosphate-sugar epimerase/quercetin dioxygenase-like cupin family protein